MKGIFSLLIAFAVSFSLFGCDLRQEQRNDLAALQSPFSAEGRLTVGSCEYPVSIRFDGDATAIDATTESNIKLGFVSQGDSITASVGNSAFHLPVGTNLGIPAVFSLLSLSRSDLREATREKAGSEDILILSFIKNSQPVTLTLRNETLIPLKIEGAQNGVFIRLVFDSFIPKDRS